MLLGSFGLGTLDNPDGDRTNCPSVDVAVKEMPELLNFLQGLDNLSAAIYWGYRNQVGLPTCAPLADQNGNLTLMGEVFDAFFKANPHEVNNSWLVPALQSLMG